MIDVVAVPERFEDAVAEAKDQEILDRILSEIVVDAVDLLFFEDIQNNFVELFSRGEVASKRFFDNDAHPGVGLVWTGQAGAAQLLDDVGIDFGRGGKIEEPVAAELFRGLEFCETPHQPDVGIGIGIVARGVREVGRKVAPFLGVDRANLGNGFGGFADAVAEGLVRHGCTSEADDGVARTERIVLREIVHGGDDFALGEIARGAKENDSTGISGRAVDGTGACGFFWHELPPRVTKSAL